MKQISFFISLLFLLTASINTKAQKNEITTSYTGSIKGMYIGGQASTNGWGFDLKYIFNKIITLKAGIETLDISHSFNYNENDIVYNLDLDYSSGGVFLLADFNYTKNLYISIGATLNSFNPIIQGEVMSDLEFGDITIPATKVGNISFNLSPSYKVSPYASVGSRSFIGKKERLTFYFETGFYYMGSPKIDIQATGLLAPTADPVYGQKELFEKQFSQYKFYPVVKLSLSLKLF